MDKIFKNQILKLKYYTGIGYYFIEFTKINKLIFMRIKWHTVLFWWYYDYFRFFNEGQMIILILNKSNI